MNALDLLQSCQSQERKPYNGFSKLSLGNHEIVKFRLVKNKMYNKRNANSMKQVILVELMDEVLFLPEYFAVPFDNDASKVDSLNNDGVKKFLCFDGKRENG